MFVKFEPSRSSKISTSPRSDEKPEGRSLAYVPMVYEKSDPDPTHWEYKTLSVDTREQSLPEASDLNELGSQGWLLVSTVSIQSSTIVNFYFLRQAE